MISADLQNEHFARAPRGYFDTAAVGTTPAGVSEAVGHVARALESGLSGSAMWHEFTDPVCEFLAADFGVAADRLTILANTGTAVASVAHAIAFADGDEVLTVADDFPNIRLAWTATAATIREVSITTETERTNEIIAAIGERTRVVAVTHVHATTGTTTDIERLHAACIANGTILVVDGAQSAGIVADVAVHSDVYIAASYKWLLSGFGGAVVATGRRFDDVARPGLVGYMNAGTPARLAVGHDPLYTYAALAAAARVRQSIGLETIRAHTSAHIERIAREADRMGFVSITRAAAGIVSLHASDAAGLVAALRERELMTAVRGDLVRVSPYVATTTADVDRLLTVLDELAPAYARVEQA